MSKEVLYQRVEWHHENAQFPIVFFSALDVNGWEVRKVDVWADGTGLTSDSVDDEDSQSTWLSNVPIPPLAEINKDPQFSGAEITADEFNAAWRKYVSGESR